MIKLNRAVLCVFLACMKCQPFGGGCLIMNDQLTISTSIEHENQQFKESFNLDLSGDVNLNSRGEAPWQPSQFIENFPGRMLNFQGRTKSIVLYIQNGRAQTRNALPEDQTFVNQAGNNSDISLFYRRLPNNTRVGIDYQNKYYLLENLYKPIPIGSPLSNLTIVSYDDTQRQYKIADGDVPLNRIGYSVTIHKNRLYITGGEDSDEVNAIYILDLESFNWKKHRASNFVGASNGCLAYTNRHLIHAFGTRQGSQVATTQFVDTKSWKLVSKFDHDKRRFPRWIPIAILVGAVLLIISLISLLIIFIRRCRKQKQRIRPPAYLLEMKWAESNFSQFEMDTKLDTLRPHSMLETTLVGIPYVPKSKVP